MKPLWNFAKLGSSDETSTCSQHSGYFERHPIHACQARPPPSAYYSVVIVVLRWMRQHQAPTMKAWNDYIISLLIRVKPFTKCRTSATTCYIAMSKDDFDETTKTLGLDAPPPEPK